MSTPLFLALDYGGTKLSAALYSPGQTTWQAQAREFSAPQATATDNQHEMIALARRLLDGQHPTAIGVSFGGPADYVMGLVHLSHHVPGWENTPLQAKLEAEFQAPTRIDNDANAAALGEHQFGAGQGLQHLFYVTVSTGVGGGWILNGQPWRGANGLAGEIGHTVVDPNGPLCLCGKRGCVERLAAGPYLAADLHEYLTSHPSVGPALREQVQGNLSQLTARTIAQVAAAGDSLAQHWIGRAGHAVGVGIGNAANLINPQHVIIGGGLSKAGTAFWSAVQTAARATALPEVPLDIVKATHPDDAPLWGAVALAQLALN